MPNTGAARLNYSTSVYRGSSIYDGFNEAGMSHLCFIIEVQKTRKWIVATELMRL
jgi:hypothetical protein